MILGESPKTTTVNISETRCAIDVCAVFIEWKYRQGLTNTAHTEIHMIISKCFSNIKFVCLKWNNAN